ncbi:MAG: cytochrome c, partial [Bacteroidetes bacterium]|nr:cytochrome c [Bacteroidota bacterium]
EGSIYQVIMYGRNMMGSHASQLTAKERWQVTMYVEQLRTELLK